MKTSSYVCFALLAIVSPSMRASSSAVNGAVIGGAAGAVIGHNSGRLHHSTWRGAAIGAGSGLWVGSVMDHHRSYRGDGRVRVSAAPRVYLYRNSSRYHGGRFHGHGYYARGWGYPGYYYRPGYAYLGFDSYAYPYATDYDSYGTRPSYAANGAILGALAGAVIGNNSGDLRHNGWAGAGLGAAAGYLVGSIAENNARRRETVLTEQAAANSPAPVQVTSAAPANATDQTVTASKPKSSSAMSSANELFGR